ncbi:MAG: AAA family ATPase, partial [Kangiellaceae bacterium]|nr:AAA family ATPase [Kangiellaceae bacterium]
MSNRYREALSHLIYGVKEGGGFVLLTGEVGTGKTTICRCLLQQLPENTRLAFVLNPKLNSLELLATICDELGVMYPENCQSLKILTDKLTEHLVESYKQNLTVVVMIDEAQNLETEVLEQIRLLTNLETHQKKLLQIILVGQPELQEKLAQRELRQLAQRITARYHLRPLNLKETIAYILHRTRIAGTRKPLFSRQSIEYLHKKTQGIPRLINTICDRALAGAASRHKKHVEKSIMAEAVKEIMGDFSSQDTAEIIAPNWFKPAAIVFSALVLLASAYWLGGKNVPSSTASQAPIQSSNVIGEPISQDSQQAVELQDEVSQGQSLVERLVGNQPWDHNGKIAFKNLFKLWQLEYS